MRTLIWTTLLAITLPVTAAVVRADDESSPAAADASAIEALIQQLGADDFQAREAAGKKLAVLGKAAQPALEKALKESKSPEVRWRADQLLQKLKGAGEKPLGAESGRPGEQGTETPPAPAGDPLDPAERIRRLMEQMEKLRQRGGSAFGSGLPGFGIPRRIEAPGLVLEPLRAGQVRLKVQREKEENQARVEDVYVGRSLSDILEQNPELLKHPGMQALKRQDAKQSWPGQGDFFKNGTPGIRVHPFPSGQGFGITTSSGVSISQGADGATVKITERGEDGKETTKEYKGESLEQIKKEHPEIADKLGGFGVHFRVGAPDFFWPGQRKRRLEPLEPTTPGVRPRTPRSPLFGVGLDKPDEALVSQLRLESGKGAVVRDVTPGSQAHKLGVERHDLILKINGEGVTLETAVRALRKAAVERAALKIELIRGGESRTLER